MSNVSEQSEVTDPSRGRSPLWSNWLDPREPQPFRGPFARWPRAADAALAVAVLAASLITVAASAVTDDEAVTIASIGDRSTAGFALLGIAAAALWWRRRHPIAVVIVELVVVIVWAVAGYGDGHEPALIVATYSVGRYTVDHRHSLAVVLTVVTISLLGTVIDDNQRVDIAPAIVATGLAWYVGRRIRSRGDYLALLQDRTRRLEAEQHAEARQAVADERARIARELHDVVAHRVSMMTVQAGAAKTIARGDLDAAIESMGDVERAGRQALGELRHLLGVLRPDPAHPDDLGPQPGLADVTSLVDELIATGAEVTLQMVDLPLDLPAAIDLSGYRIVQESCTNIIKHAGLHPLVKIDVGLDGPVLTIEITNSIDASAPDLPGAGYGIAGMRERANLLGGTLTAALQPPDHYRVLARLPLEPEPT